ncbi:glutamine--fructose-6-phosphate transaminase (isomerizing) [Patescibacteria group bacterium]|nr:glutamine--fructose-6-phosphate transaminase (isomerizing) [Patescibacteria group bacterium]
MCGIFAVVNDKTNQASQTVLEGLKKLEYRGYDSWGIAIKSAASKLEVEKHVGKIGEAKTSLPEGSLAIGHTRWATHGGVTDANAHPHLDCTGKLAIIHNGIVENYLEFKEDLIKKGHKFSSETDTETVAHLIEEKIKRLPLEKAVFETFNLLVGSNAIGVIDMETETIIACRNGSPLAVGVDEANQQFFLGSDVTAFLKYTNSVHFLEDGEAVVMSRSGVKLYDVKSGKEKPLTLQKLDWKLEDAEKSGYPHFLLKEIMEQKETIAKTAALNETEIIKISESIRNGDKVVLLGCGTASYCALAGKYFLAQAGIESQAYGGYEFLPFSGFANDKTVVIAISQSGETADTLIAARAAKKAGARIVSIVNARGSTLERLSETVLSVGAGPEIAVVSTKAFTAQLATLYLLAKACANKYDEGKQRIKNFKEILDRWMNQDLTDRLIELAKNLIDQEHAYLIGKHLNYPAALEFALKIKETAYIHAEPFAAGELKHGVITLIQKGTPCFVLASNDDVKGEILSSAAELKARGGKIIGIAPFRSEEFEEAVQTPDLGELTVIPNIIVGQFLGYFLGVGRGADPDKPRNLAKSVTVK